MSKSILQEKNLLNLFLELIDDKTDKEIFKMVFCEGKKQDKLDKMIEYMEKKNDQD